MVGKIDRAAVIGAGTMGSDISFLFAVSDIDVILNDRSKAVLDLLDEKFRSIFAELQQMGLMKESFEEIRERITVTDNIDDIKDVDFVLETIIEDLEIKRRLFSELDKLPMEVVLTTNTSSLRVTDVAEGLKGAERVGGMHFSNPPILSPLVEVVKGEKTSEKTLDFIVEVAEKIGRTPVVLTKDMNGFVMNRILSAMANEPLWAFHRGEITPEELDASLRAVGYIRGFAEAVDIIGLDIALTVGRIFREAYGKRMEFPEELLEKMVNEGRLGKKSGRGFHDWSRGAPVIDLKLAGKYDSMIIVASAANEAFWLMVDEVANPETIDNVIKLGFRSEIGMCELADLVGLDNLIDILRRMYAEYRIEFYKPCPLFEEYVEKGWTGKAVGRGFYKY
ncbi:MAG: 3-hydroxyacyl-CoA dehydrogenase [Candidatus Lokiarchaeia archaeon]